MIIMMTRIDGPYRASEVQQLAELLSIPCVWRLGRCQHGYTRSQTCIECENGYVDDCHTFAGIGNTATSNVAVLAGVSDDGDYVAYIPAHAQRHIDKAHVTVTYDTTTYTHTFSIAEQA